MNRGAWWATIHGVAKSWTRLSNSATTIPIHVLSHVLLNTCTHKTKPAVLNSQGTFIFFFLYTHTHTHTHIFIVVHSLSHVQLFVTSWTVAHQAPLSMWFSRQEYWSGLPFPSSENLPDPGIKLKSPALASVFFTGEPPGKSTHIYAYIIYPIHICHICCILNIHIFVMYRIYIHIYV